MTLLRSVVICAVLAGAAYAGWHFTRPAKRAPEAALPVPVTAATSKQASLPHFIPTIGNVRALNLVEIRPQVGGVLIDVAVHEGDAVTKGQVLGVIDPRPLKAALDKAQAQLIQDQAQLGNAQSDQKRYNSLAQKEFASRQQVDTQNSAVGRLQGVIAADTAAITEAQINLGYAVLRSPIAGRVGLRRVDAGNLVTANGTGPGIFSVVQEQPISVIFSLPESDLPRVRDAMKAGPLPTLADAPGNGRLLDRGVLRTADNNVNSDSGTIQMRADFPNPDLLLTPGQFVNVRLQIGTVSGVVVPHLAIQHGIGGLFVFEIDANKSVRRRDVKVAYDDGAEAVLADGLPADAIVVTEGQSRVGEGTKVSFKEPAQPRAATLPQRSAAR